MSPTSNARCQPRCQRQRRNGLCRSRRPGGVGVQRCPVHAGSRERTAPLPGARRSTPGPRRRCGVSRLSTVCDLLQLRVFVLVTLTVNPALNRCAVRRAPGVRAQGARTQEPVSPV